MRIAVLTFHRAYNCGAALQAWALKTVLVRMGHTVEFPVCNHVGESDRWSHSIRNGKRGLKWVRAFLGRTLMDLLSIPNVDILRWRYRRFRNRFLPERECGVSEFDKYYDSVIIGSDQVWNPKHAGKYQGVFLGEGFPPAVRKVAYAASFGDMPLGDEPLCRLVDGLSSFSAISVREQLAKNQLTEASSRDVAEVIDPTLLLQASDYDEIAEGSVPEEPYLFFYTVALTNDNLKLVHELSRRLKVKSVVAPCYQQSRLRAPKGVTFAMSPGQLVQYARQARYIVSFSFHGVVMAILFKKKFISLQNRDVQYETRQARLLGRLGCLQRIVTPSMSIKEVEVRIRAELPDYGDKLSWMRDESLGWLQKTLTPWQ